MVSYWVSWAECRSGDRDAIRKAASCQFCQGRCSRGSSAYTGFAHGGCRDCRHRGHEVYVYNRFIGDSKLGGVERQLSILVPVYNECENVAPMVREVAAALSGTGVDYELVFIDDASKDGTWEEITKARMLDGRVRGLRHTRNAGQSAAL